MKSNWASIPQSQLIQQQLFFLVDFLTNLLDMIKSAYYKINPLNVKRAIICTVLTALGNCQLQFQNISITPKVGPDIHSDCALLSMVIISLLFICMGWHQHLTQMDPIRWFFIYNFPYVTKVHLYSSISMLLLVPTIGEVNSYAYHLSGFGQACVLN